MGNCDNALLSKHKANPVKSKMCYYSLYRTKETKEKLKLLCDVRADYIKRILFEKTADIRDSRRAFCRFCFCFAVFRQQFGRTVVFDFDSRNLFACICLLSFRISETAGKV